VVDWTRWQWRRTGSLWTMIDAAGLQGITLMVQPDMIGDEHVWLCGIWVYGIKPKHRFWTETAEAGKELLQDLLGAALSKAIDLTTP
jgi:hypothetical protein